MYGQLYAEQFAAALKEAGWVFDPPPGMAAEARTPLQFGVCVTMNGADATPEGHPTEPARAFADVLYRLKIRGRNTVIADPDVSRGLLSLFLGCGP
jgi:hypothetical protein